MPRKKRVLVLAVPALLLLAAAAWLVAGLAGGSRPAAPTAGPEAAIVLHQFEPTGRPAPEAAFTDAEGRELTLADFAGRPLLVNLWATWCAPCVEEMPSLDRLQAAFPDGGLEVVAISLDRQGAEAVAPFYREHGVSHLAIYADTTGSVLQSFAARGLPISILIDAAGREVGRYAGANDWDGPEALALLQEQLAVPPPAQRVGTGVSLE